MPYEILEHTADLRMRVTADSPEELFRDATAGMLEFLGGKKVPGAAATTRILKVAAADYAALLVDFLSEVLAAAQINRETYDEIKIINLSATAVETHLRGLPVSEFAEDIKAVTHHEAKVRQNEQGQWETNLVFDI